MIKSFGVRNYTCFMEWMELDCSLNDQVPERFHNGNSIAPILCLKGSNASGKTNALKAIVWLVNFIKHSFLSSTENPYFIDTFFGNKEPTEFYINFLNADGIEYLYELKLDEKTVYYEKLIKDKKVVLHREKQDLKNTVLFNKKKIPLNQYSSVISSAFYYPETKTAITPIYSFFEHIFTNVSRFGFTQYPDAIIFDPFRISSFSQEYKNNNEAFVFMQKHLKRFDTGIDRIEIKSQKLPDGKPFYYPVFTHISTDKQYTLLEESESSGTRALFNNLLYYYFVLYYGGVLLFDEFDINLHPDILPCLLELFINPETNPNKAQIIFTTHNNDIMELAGKYRTYLFEKEDNKSYCYRLDELNGSLIRNDRSITRLYEKGLLGGVPKVSAYGI